jgi:hypothetical protein
MTILLWNVAPTDLDHDSPAARVEVIRCAGRHVLFAIVRRRVCRRLQDPATHGAKLDGCAMTRCARPEEAPWAQSSL